MRLLIVSNRLPITIEKKNGEINIRESSGGLVSGLSSYLDSLKGSTFPSKNNYIWIGWPGLDVEDKDQHELKQRILKEYNAYSVFLSEDTMENFYQGFCNKTIWPLFHYFPTYAAYEEKYWDCYVQVNKKFCETIMEIMQPDDVLWIHDYHLMLLPKMIRDKNPGVQIGFFHHIPFPTFEIFSLLPSKWRNGILEGLLGADIIGFHTYDYTQYFLRCVLRILGIESDMGTITLTGHTATADTFPMGIDFTKFNNSLSSKEVKENIAELKQTLNYEKVILSIDRLDYTKGIINRLHAYKIFLEKNPEWIGKVILILKVIPSRIGVDQYSMMKKQIDELVGSINGKFGSVTWTPISYQYDFIPFSPLVALYSFSDIILVTPLRDGMNLISKEYLACRADKTGVMILSEMAGASKELGEALIINPNYKEEIASAIVQAIEMPPDEQITRNEIMQERLRRYDVVRWADDFIQKTISAKREMEKIKSKVLNEERIEQILSEYKQANKRLIFLDYDGTLVPFADYPELAKPGDALIKILNRFSLDEKTDCIIISGRNKESLNEWFGMTNIELIAEHGALLKRKNNDWEMIKPLLTDWKPQIHSIFEIYRDRLPGSFIEEKAFSVAWHYRKCEPELASLRAKELVDHLVSLTANIDIQVLKGSKVIEVRNSGVSKGTAGLMWMPEGKYDFIMAIGDDWTDEDLFKVLPPTAYSIKVGPSASYAKYYLPNPGGVINLLNRLVGD